MPGSMTFLLGSTAHIKQHALGLQQGPCMASPAVEHCQLHAHHSALPLYAAFTAWPQPWMQQGHHQRHCPPHSYPSPCPLLPPSLPGPSPAAAFCSSAACSSMVSSSLVGPSTCTQSKSVSERSST